MPHGRWPTVSNLRKFKVVEEINQIQQSNGEDASGRATFPRGINDVAKFCRNSHSVRVGYGHDYTPTMLPVP